MNTLDIVKAQLAESARVKQELLQDQDAVDMIGRVAELCTEVCRKGNKVMWAGNGGSAADAQHMACELVSKFYLDRPAIPSIALTTNTSILTAISNDVDFIEVFSRQIEALGNKGDVFIGISTSGNSKNLVRALDSCKTRKIFSVALVGRNPCKMDAYDYVIHIPSVETPRIQESQTLICHIICCIVEQNLYGKNQ